MDGMTAPPVLADGLVTLVEATAYDPSAIPAWKGKAALREAGLLGTVEAAVAGAGGRVQDAWVGASEWSRDSEFLTALAANLGLSSASVDDLFRSADAMQS